MHDTATVQNKSRKSQWHVLLRTCDFNKTSGLMPVPLTKLRLGNYLGAALRTEKRQGPQARSIVTATAAPKRSQRLAHFDPAAVNAPRSICNDWSVSNENGFPASVVFGST